MYLHIGNQLHYIMYLHIVNVVQILFSDYCITMNSSSIWV